MPSSGKPPVENGVPPRLVLRLTNPIVRAMLRSPLHRLLGHHMLLTVTGRKSGREYTVPVGRHELDDGTLLVACFGSWRLNLRGGAPVRVVLDGREHEGYAELEEDPDRVAQAYKTLIDRVGHSKASRIGLKANVDRPPTADEIKPAVAQRGVARIRLS